MYIRTPSGKTLLSGETNEQGEFSFPAPAEDQGTLEVTVQAGAAHKGSWPIKSGEYLPENTGEKHETKQPPDKKPGGCVETNIESRLDEDELRTIVREILVKELAPIKKELAELRQDRITLQDIISGLGYILGLMGIALYFKTKRR
jgi:nickel transport protein